MIQINIHTPSDKVNISNYIFNFQELKASFLDESSHLSAASQQIGNATAGDVTLGAIHDETSQSSFTSVTRTPAMRGALVHINISHVSLLYS